MLAPANGGAPLGGRRKSESDLTTAASQEPAVDFRDPCFVERQARTAGGLAAGPQGAAHARPSALRRRRGGAEHVGVLAWARNCELARRTPQPNAGPSTPGVLASCRGGRVARALGRALRWTRARRRRRRARRARRRRRRRPTPPRCPPGSLTGACAPRWHRGSALRRAAQSAARPPPPNAALETWSPALCGLRISCGLSSVLKASAALCQTRGQALAVHDCGHGRWQFITTDAPHR